MSSRRAAAFALTLTCSTAAYGQTEASYPARPLRLIVPFAAGGTTDTVARLLARELTKSLAQSIVVENRAGAGGLIGAEAVLKLPADGYTLAFATISTLAVLPLAQTKPSYERRKDFALITQIATLPYVARGTPFVARAFAAATGQARARAAPVDQLWVTRIRHRSAPRGRIPVQRDRYEARPRRLQRRCTGLHRPHRGTHRARRIPADQSGAGTSCRSGSGIQ